MRTKPTRTDKAKQQSDKGETHKIIEINQLHQTLKKWLVSEKAKTNHSTTLQLRDLRLDPWLANVMDLWPLCGTQRVTHCLLSLHRDTVTHRQLSVTLLHNGDTLTSTLTLLWQTSKERKCASIVCPCCWWKCTAITELCSECTGKAPWVKKWKCALLSIESVSVWQLPDWKRDPPGSCRARQGSRPHARSREGDAFQCPDPPMLATDCIPFCAYIPYIESLHFLLAQPSFTVKSHIISILKKYLRIGAAHYSLSVEDLVKL